MMQQEGPDQTLVSHSCLGPRKNRIGEHFPAAHPHRLQFGSGHDSPLLVIISS